MKFWRTIAVIALVGAFAATAFAGSKCDKAELEAVPVFPLVMCAEYQDDTQTSWGNGFPWENSTFYFSTYRNQFLYPSATVTGVLANGSSINSLSTRGTSFTGNASHQYGAFRNGMPSSINVTGAIADTLVRTFAANANPAVPYCYMDSTAGNMVIDMYRGPGGAMLSTCASCPGASEIARDKWCDVGDLPLVAVPGNILVDTSLAVAGGSGGAVWDMTNTQFGEGCPGPERAYGSGSFVNSNHMTTAIGIDTSAFIWVFEGKGKPPAASVEQQIAEIIRLLLTPQGLRCSGLDMNPGNDTIEDDPVQFPGGKDIDPISPQIVATHGDGFVTGDEWEDDLRRAGFKAP